MIVVGCLGRKVLQYARLCACQAGAVSGQKRGPDLGDGQICGMGKELRKLLHSEPCGCLEMAEAVMTYWALARQALRMLFSLGIVTKKDEGVGSPGFI